MVLSYSRKAYSEAVLRQDTETFLRCLENGLRAFGGVPLLLNLDNLKAAVLKADWFDPEINPKLADFCRREDLWFHADAAWGGAAILSPALKEHLAGIEHADSITFDAHKWLSVPMACGMFFCRHRESVARAFHSEVTYMSGKQSGPVFDPLTNSMQWSRRFIGLKMFLALAHMGESGYAAMIDHQARLGNVLRQALTASGWQVVNETPLPLVCFTREHLDPGAFLASLHRRQIAWMSEARVGGAAVLRACITNFRTTDADIHQIVEEMNQLFQEGLGVLRGQK